MTNLDEHWDALVAVAVTNASTRAIGAIHDRIAELEAEVKRLTPKPSGPMHSCDGPLCAVCGSPYA